MVFIFDELINTASFTACILYFLLLIIPVIWQSYQPASWLLSCYLIMNLIKFFYPLSRQETECLLHYTYSLVYLSVTFQESFWPAACLTSHLRIKFNWCCSQEHPRTILSYSGHTELHLIRVDFNFSHYIICWIWNWQ